ncbi:MAG: hypothetical protein ISR22_04725 [Candidatus Poseidoniaceae archaeon]|nr:hypothetical protein [Candidatus Poseidoniaceae archaeon]
MSEDSNPKDDGVKRDEMIRKKNFSRARGLDISSFMVNDEKGEQESESVDLEEEVVKDIDKAMGEVAELFSRGGDEHKMAGAVQKDGTVIKPPENDSVTDMSIHGEKRLGFGLLIAMVFIWSAIGTIVGTVLAPVVSAIGLILMVVIGLLLGEKWIPNPNMRILGVTWVIISMKLFYGLAIDMWRWDWLANLPIEEGQALGIFLLSAVGLNIFLAQRHDEDAIAAQATLILLIIGSATGALYGELGIAVMIVAGTILLHGLALLRNSGNLASLGIAVSYLWIGAHAISNNWNLFGLEIIPFEDDLILFLLMVCITAANATMAAKFVDADNWFSAAFKSLGLGKPGLWSVSVGLGMIGALLAIAANRLETGYALAQLVLLLTAFSASYLVVRGVPWTKLAPWVLVPAPFLLAALSLMVSGAFDAELERFSLQPYSLYAAMTALFTASALLRHQTAVSDHVLWAGGLVIVTLLTLLIPADDQSTGSRTLLISQGVVWIGLSYLAVQRNSPSIAGTAVIAPWIWLLFFATDAENRLISADFIPVAIAEYDLAMWMGLLLVQQVWVNIEHGETGLNIASRLAGLSEFNARLRDSAVLQLWNLSFLLTLFVTWAITRPGALPAYGLYGILCALLAGHVAMVYLGKHKGKPRSLMTVWGISAVALSWTYGQAAIWALTLVAACAVLLHVSDRMKASGANEFELKKAEALPGQLLTLMMGLLSGFFVIIALDPLNMTVLTGSENLLSDDFNLIILTVITLAAIALYLVRASTLEKLLPPALSAVGLMVVMILAGQVQDSGIVVLLTIAAFIVSGAYLALQGEFRSGMRALARKEDRLARIEEKRQRMADFISQNSETESQESIDSEVGAAKKESNLQMIDVELLDLAEKQRKRAKRAGSIGQYDLEVGDIHHRPVIVISFLVTVILASMFLSFTTGNGFTILAFCVMISILFITLARLRANQIGLRLPDVMGIELPIAISMVGLVLVHITGRISNSVIELDDAKHLAVIAVGLTILSGVGLLGRSDLGLRIPNALEGIVYLLAFDRIMCVIIGGEVPLPFQFDPFDGALVDWIIPLVFIEVLMLGFLFGFDWVEGERIKRGLADHRGSGGRSAWLVFASMVSFGPAAILALLFGIRRGWSWQQPAVVMIAWIMLPLPIHGTLFWANNYLALPVFGMNITAAILGVVSIMFVVWSIVESKGIWLASALWSVHILLLSAGIGWGDLAILSVFVMICSTTAWVSGIITLRKSWRVFGAADLVIAWIIAFVMLSQGGSVESILTVLVASAGLLGLVTYLTQTYEAEMEKE